MIVLCSFLTVLLAVVDTSAVKDLTSSSTVAPTSAPVSSSVPLSHFHVGKHKRQIFREQVNPFIGGRIPETAYHTDRLLLNRLNAAGFSLPDGVLLAHKRPPIGHSEADDQSAIVLRILQTADNRPTPPEGVTHRPEPVESTYLLRVPAGWKHGKVQGLPALRPVPGVIQIPGPEHLSKLEADQRSPSPSSALQPPPPPQRYHQQHHPPPNHPPPQKLPHPPPTPPNHPPLNHPPPPPPPNHPPHPPPPNHPPPLPQNVHFHPHQPHYGVPHPQPTNFFPVVHGTSAQSLVSAHLRGSIFNDPHSVDDFDSSLLLNDEDLELAGPWESFFSDEQSDFFLPDRLSIPSRLPKHSAYHFEQHQNNRLRGLAPYGRQSL